MVLEVNKIFGNLENVQTVGVSKKQPVQQPTFKSSNTFNIKGSADPFNSGELAPVTDCTFDSNKWITNFGQ